ncbi:hypothetical protein ACS0TY_008849 [Phlomoides rotata]
MLQRAASSACSWWWASHIRTKQSKWLEQSMMGRIGFVFVLMYNVQVYLLLHVWVFVDFARFDDEFGLCLLIHVHTCIVEHYRNCTNWKITPFSLF